MIYQPRVQSKSAFLTVRGLKTHVRSWGRDTAPPVLLLHGALDCSATFQFAVDALQNEWRILAPDWRGHGQTEWASQGYWFPDYLGDLHGIINQLCPATPVVLIGHSLGGNVACIYAGICPERVSRLISLDGFGLPDGRPEDAPGRLRRWLDGASGQTKPRVYETLDAMAARLRVTNPRLDIGKSLFLAQNLSMPHKGGGYVWAFDPRHRAPFATLHRKAEWTACVAKISAPALLLASAHPVPSALAGEPGGLEARAALFARGRLERLADTSHNLHHDAPGEVARLIEDFLTS